MSFSHSRDYRSQWEGEVECMPTQESPNCPRVLENLRFCTRSTASLESCFSSLCSVCKLWSRARRSANKILGLGRASGAAVDWIILLSRYVTRGRCASSTAKWGEENIVIKIWSTLYNPHVLPYSSYPALREEKIPYKYNSSPKYICTSFFLS